MGVLGSSWTALLIFSSFVHLPSEPDVFRRLHAELCSELGGRHLPGRGSYRVRVGGLSVGVRFRESVGIRLAWVVRPRFPSAGG